MKKCILLIDLGFGDNGKGASTDFLCREHQCDLVVRYSGGPQAGHVVELPNGTRHRFSQFGAGTFAGAKTFLGPSMIVNPRGIQCEAAAIQKLGVPWHGIRGLRIHPHCLVSTLLHQAANRIKEESRPHRHGSCGLGIGETRSYWLKYGLDAIFAADLKNIALLGQKLELMRQRLWDEILQLDTPVITAENNFSTWRIRELVDALFLNSDNLDIDDELQDHSSVVYEPAQGVLLDQTVGFPPHTTWSDVTLRPALELLDADEYNQVTTLGITRAYTCRHGEGPLPTYSKELTESAVDPGNPPNPWQGAIRMGWLDMPLLTYAIDHCGAKLDGLIVNHLDQLTDNPQWCPYYKGDCQPFQEGQRFAIPTIKRQLSRAHALSYVAPKIESASKEGLIAELNSIVPVVITANGPTHLHRTFRSK